MLSTETFILLMEITYMSYKKSLKVSQTTVIYSNRHNKGAKRDIDTVMCVSCRCS